MPNAIQSRIVNDEQTVLEEVTVSRDGLLCKSSRMQTVRNDTVTYAVEVENKFVKI